MNELKKIQSRDIEEKMLIALNEVLDVLEYTKMDVANREISYGCAKKVANKYIPILLRNNNRLREFRLFMDEKAINKMDIDLTERLDRIIKFYC